MQPRNVGGLGGAGIALAVVSWVLYNVPGIFIPASISNAHAVCTSTLGVLAQDLDGQVRADCSNVALGATVLQGAILVGVVVAAVGAISWAASRRGRGDG
jgi:hypothetical protein